MVNEGDFPFYDASWEQTQGVENKIVIMVVGEDRIGIIAAITSLLAEYQVNIEDITQKILGDYFTMILVADISKCNLELGNLREKLTQKGREIGVQVFLHQAGIFRAMHRI
ncbi:MAG: hypothetical protein PWP04_480 [Candidatus Atribacteria bacterium]|nr:hypothetical protein [Candidatus Atribacteria bacterium]